MAAAPAEAKGPLDGYLARIRAALEEAAAARAPAPPVLVRVKWGAKKIGALELPAPLLALEAADLDGDGRDEVIGLTTGEVLILAVSRKSIAVAARAPLPPQPALIRSRDPVGALAIDGPVIHARTSEQAAGGRYRFKAGALALESGASPGFPLCTSLTAELESGKNSFDPKTARWSRPAPVSIAAPFFAVECRSHVGVDGKPMATVAVVDASRVVAVSCSRPGGNQPGGSPTACPADALGASEIKASGTAVEVADVDRDGRLEVITSNGQAPGRKDRVRAFAHGPKKPRQVFSHRFDRGVIALSAPDLDGDGARDVIAAARTPGDRRIHLWVLTRPR